MLTLALVKEGKIKALFEYSHDQPGTVFLHVVDPAFKNNEDDIIREIESELGLDPGEIKLAGYLNINPE